MRCIPYLFLFKIALREIIITRGTVAQEIRSQLSGVVVKIDITDYDLLKILYPMAGRTKPIAVIECDRFTEKAKRVGTLLGIPIREYLVRNLDDFLRLTETALADGITDIIGGGWGEYNQDFIQDYGLTYTSVVCTKEAARTALNKALTLYQVRQEEKRQREFLQTINSFSLNGILGNL